MRNWIRLTIACAAGLAFMIGGTAALAQETPAENDSGASQKLIRELLDRLGKVEGELARLKAQNGQVPVDRKDQKIHTLLETPYLGASYFGTNNGARFFVAKLVFINLTPQPVTIRREHISLTADGTAHKLEDVPQQMQYQSFNVGNQGFQLRNLQPAVELKIAPGKTASTWVVFTGLPAGQDIPELILKLNLGDTKSELDVNEYALGLLGMKVERIGPRESLALITISGEFNTINLGALTDALDKLTTQKVARAVIRWTDSAPALDGQLVGWLAQAAYQAGRGEAQNGRFPVVPLSVRELHLAQVPHQENSGYGIPAQGPTRIHKTDREAVAAALRSAYEVLPLDELLREIENGHPLTRAAALEGGGGRLPAEKLPLLLKYADDNDPVMQQAALSALRHFGEPQAIEKLVHYAKKNAEPTVGVAVESLAASRYTAAHDALLELLKNEGPESRKTIVGVLARHPRPAWSDAIYEFVKDPNSGLGIEGVRALAMVGHPKLHDVFEKALASPDIALRNETFNLLVGRQDEASEELAMQFTLAHIAKAPPTPQMNQLLHRTRDRRALPPLLEQFEHNPDSRSAIIGTLAVIGDQTVGDVLVKAYPELKQHEQTAALNALVQLKSPAFRELAGKALFSSDSSIVSTAAQGLQSDGSPEAVELLIAAFEKSKNTNTWSYTANALSTVGTAEAKAALQRAANSSNRNKRNYASNALRNMRQRSPGYQYIYQAEQYSRQKKYAEAIAQYSIAIEIDGELPEAYAGRANVYLKQNKHKEARADFAKALELDPLNSQAITGKAILDVMDGEVAAAVKAVEEARDKFRNDPLFAYNAACVYSQAIGALKKDEKADDREMKMKEYREKALADLRRSVKLGFQDFDWMKQDPDFKPLADDAEFQKITTGNVGDGGEAEVEQEAEPASEAATLEIGPVIE